MEGVLRQGDIEWVAKCMVTFRKPLDETTQHPADIEALLQKHKAVFEDRPIGRPPDRGFEHSFGVGDFVYLRLQPYRQSSLKKKGAEKLKPRFYGPYKVIRKVGEVAYRKVVVSALIKTIHCIWLFFQRFTMYFMCLV